MKIENTFSVRERIRIAFEYDFSRTPLIENLLSGLRYPTRSEASAMADAAVRTIGSYVEWMDEFIKIEIEKAMTGYYQNPHTYHYSPEKEPDVEPLK
jgi:hypothetical protein